MPPKNKSKKDATPQTHKKKREAISMKKQQPLPDLPQTDMETPSSNENEEPQAIGGHEHPTGHQWTKSREPGS